METLFAVLLFTLFPVSMLVTAYCAADTAREEFRIGSYWSALIAALCSLVAGLCVAVIIGATLVNL